MMKDIKKFELADRCIEKRSYHLISMSKVKKYVRRIRVGLIMFMVVCCILNISLHQQISLDCHGLCGDHRFLSLLAVERGKSQKSSYLPTDDERNAIAGMVEYSFRRVNISSVVDRATYFPRNERCAFNFYGLPRSFSTMTLPSVVENILIPNALLDCDVFVYYHHLTSEEAGRSGDGGSLNPNEVLLLEEAMRQVGARAYGPVYSPIIRFGHYTDFDFLSTYSTFLNRTRMERDQSDPNHLLFLPRNDPTYTFTQVDNIVKMWHSQQAVFELMERTAMELGVSYTRIGMFRNDVLFVTPINILEDGNASIDKENKIAVLPGFSRAPVNDRKYLRVRLCSVCFMPPLKLVAYSSFAHRCHHRTVSSRTYLGKGSIHSRSFLFENDTTQTRVSRVGDPV